MINRENEQFDATRPSCHYGDITAAPPRTTALRDHNLKYLIRDFICAQNVAWTEYRFGTGRISWKFCLPPTLDAILHIYLDEIGEVWFHFQVAIAYLNEQNKSETMERLLDLNARMPLPYHIGVREVDQLIVVTARGCECYGRDLINHLLQNLASYSAFVYQQISDTSPETMPFVSSELRSDPDSPEVETVD
jgi:hypothetical protein